MDRCMPSSAAEHWVAGRVQVTFVPACVGAEAEAATKDPAQGSIIVRAPRPAPPRPAAARGSAHTARGAERAELAGAQVLENVRFHKEEEGKGVDHVEGCKKKKCGDDCKTVKASEAEVVAFREGLAKHGDVYVCDAFGTAHRAHASLVGMKGKMPCVAGLLVQKELAAFEKVLDPAKVKRPLLAIVGGAKISDKILVIENLIKNSDGIIACGGMAYTFKKVCHGMEIGKSLFDKKGAELAPKLMEAAKAKGIEITLPVDWACGQDFCNDQEIKMVTEKEGIPEGWEGMDCGPESMKLFREKIVGAKTVIWNGPAGVFEFDNFAKGTKAVLDAVAETTSLGAPRAPRPAPPCTFPTLGFVVQLFSKSQRASAAGSAPASASNPPCGGERVTRAAGRAAGNSGIIGGGDSATAAAKFNMEDQVTFVSTGGGASLELLEGKVLPGIDALDAK